MYAGRCEKKKEVEMSKTTIEVFKQIKTVPLNWEMAKKRNSYLDSNEFKNENIRNVT